MGEKQNQPFQLSFNASLKVDFQGSRVTSDGGLILVRELDERLGLGELIERHLTDSRRGKNTQLPLADLLRQSVYSRLAGYEDVNDAERLAQDPTYRLIGSEKIWERGAALTSRLHSFETEVLTQEENLAVLAAMNRELIAKAEAVDSPQRVILDMDSTEILVYGQQEQSAYNGHFESTCYHPLLLFNHEDDCLGAELRPGNVHSAEGWEELLLPEIEHQQKLSKEVVFRSDAAFAKPEIYEALEKRGVKYTIRIPCNDSLERDIAELLTRPVGRPSHQPPVRYKSFLYQAASWQTARRVVAKAEFHFGELFPRVGFIVTNLEVDSRAVVRFYNKRGTAEQWIKEGSEIDAAELSSISVERGAPLAERARLQLGEPLASAGATAEDQQLDLDHLATALGENRRTADQARTVPLAPVGGESSHARVVWSHAGQDRSASITSGLGEPPPRPAFKQRAGRREGNVSEESVERGTDSCLVILRSGKTGPFRSRWKLPTLKTRLAIACSRSQAYDLSRAGVHNGNSGLEGRV